MLRGLLVSTADPAHPITRALERIRLTLEWDAVHTPAELAEALARGSPEVVLVDDHPPAMDGLELLAVIRRPNLPVIVLTRDDQEERAAALLEAGASDVVMAGQPRRLAAVIRRELRLAQEGASRRETKRRAAERFALLEAVLAQLPVILWVIDPEGRIVLATGDRLAYLGIAAEDLRGRLAADLVPNNPEVVEALQRARRGEAAEVNFTLNEAVLSATFLPSHNAHGAVQRVIGISVDVTERARLIESLRREAERLTAIIASQDAIGGAGMDRRAVETAVVVELRRIVGADAVGIALVEGDELVFQPVAGAGFPALRLPLHGSLGGLCVTSGETQVSEDIQSDPRTALAAAAYPEMRSMVVAPLRHRQHVLGTVSLVSRHSHAFSPADVQTMQILAAFGGAMLSRAFEYEEKRSLLEERSAMLSQLRQLALYDPLTDLPNRTLFQQRLEEALERAEHPAVLLIDLDHFKEVNDTFGHEYGDLVLADVGRRLAGEMRPGDTIARLGGDEFGVLLPGGCSRARLAARELLRAVELPSAVRGQALFVSASIGIALAPEHGRDVSTLLRRADIAMYRAKRQRGGFALYEAGLDVEGGARLALTGDLRHAIEADALALYFQPQHDRTGRVRAVEALTRWRHPERGFISPAEFIPLAERAGLIRPFTRWSLEAALSQAVRWRRQGIALQVAVNLSPAALHDPDLAQAVWEALTRHGARPEWLALEITETAIMTQPELAMRTVTQLHGLGVRISIDDFGTGYSSLSYLRDFPADELKLGPTFVQQTRTNSRQASIAQLVIDLGHQLGLEVVAEGVEDAATLAMITDMGADLIQDHYLSHAMPGEELVGWLEGRG